MANLSGITCTYEVRLLPQATISWLQIWEFFWGVTLPGLLREVRMLPGIPEITFHAEITQEQFTAPVIWMLTEVSSCFRSTLLAVMQGKVAKYLLWFPSLHLGLLFAVHIWALSAAPFMSPTATYTHLDIPMCPVLSPATSPCFPYLHI